MIKHIVLFKLADEAEGNSKAENAAIIRQRLEALKDSIPEILKIEVAINHAGAPAGNYDIMLDSEFRNLNDLQTYISHPEHQKVGEFIVKVRTGRAAIDYQFWPASRPFFPLKNEKRLVERQIFRIFVRFFSQNANMNKLLIIS